MSVGEAIVKYFNERNDFAALAVDKIGQSELIQVFLIKGISILNVKCRYTESHLVINSLVPEFVVYESGIFRSDFFNYINSTLNNGMFTIGEQDSYEYNQICSYAELYEIHGLLDVAIKNAWDLYEERAEVVALNMVSQFMLEANMRVFFTR